MTIYTAITPTYLYIKQHSVTGLKYFGKTVKKDPIKYKGSGTRWSHHIKKHGKQFVETIWLSELYTNTSIVEHALHFSVENNIVESDDWANLIPENGLDGTDGQHSTKPFSFLKKEILITGINLNQYCRLNNLNQSAMQGVLTGRLYIHKNYTSSDPIHIEFWKIEIPKRKKTSRQNQSKSLKGKPKSELHKENLSASLTGKNNSHSDETKSKLSAKFFTLIETKQSFNKISLSRYHPEFKQHY